MNHYVIDYETLINCTVLCAQHYKNSEDIKVFVISKLRDNTNELIQFLIKNRDNNEFHISFNGLEFDSQISQHILLNIHDFLLKSSVNPELTANNIYNHAQKIIESRDNKNTPNYQITSEKNLLIKQIDVFKLNHWDNPAKQSSLKWIEYSMDWYNIQEMPIHHSTYIETQEQLDTIIRYCINDVKATAKIFELSKDQIELRLALTKSYDVNLINASEPRISKTLFSLFLSKAMGIKPWDLNQLRTYRDKIYVNDIILPYINFRRIEFKTLLEKFKSLVIDTDKTKDGFKYSLKYKNVKTDYGLGGMHGAAASGIYEAKNGMLIMTSDAVSFYPMLAINNKWSPAHLPQEEFCSQYRWFFDERKKVSKKDPKNYVYKIILNSTYGLSNDKNSFLYDPDFTMRIK